MGDVQSADKPDLIVGDHHRDRPLRILHGNISDEPCIPNEKRLTECLDAGLTGEVTPGLNIAAFGHNLSYPNHAFLPTVVGGAIGYANDLFTVEVDGVADLSSYTGPSARVMGGGEFLVAGHVPLALGYRFDLLDPKLSRASHQLSAGAGYVSRQFGLRVAVRRTLVGPSATAILASVSYHLESSGAVAITPY